jgi:transcriptional regulator with XRE-family HTH domain
MGEDLKINFGEYFESLRQNNGFTLRVFCKRAQADPGNISKLERGAMVPPKDPSILERYAKALNIQEGSDDWYRFFDLAAIAHGMVPNDLLNDREILQRLPIFFRTLRGQKPTTKEMKSIIGKIRKGGR